MADERKMAIYWLETKDKRRAVVIARSYQDAPLYATMEDPTGGWYNAIIHYLTPCRTSMTPRVVSLEGKNEKVRLLLAECLEKLEAEPAEIGCHVGRHADRKLLERVLEVVNGN